MNGCRINVRGRADRNGGLNKVVRKRGIRDDF